MIFCNKRLKIIDKNAFLSLWLCLFHDHGIPTKTNVTIKTERFNNNKLDRQYYTGTQIKIGMKKEIIVQMKGLQAM